MSNENLAANVAGKDLQAGQLQSPAVAGSILEKVRDALAPLHLDLINESHRHAGPATDSHFKLVVVSEAFNGQNLVKRHQSLYRLLREELSGPVHALALHTYTPAEWAVQQNAVPASPNCRGGSKNSL